MSVLVVAIITCLVTLIVVTPISWTLASKSITKKNNETIGDANVKARNIIDEAVKTAESTKKEALLEVKEERLKSKNELEKETKERRAEVQKYERRVLTKEETLDKKNEAVEKRDQALAKKRKILSCRDIRLMN